MQRLGFVGTGMMGGPMAACLLRVGFAVTVHDVRRERIEALAAEGASVAERLEDLAACDVVVVMVNTDAQAREVLGALIDAPRGGSRTVLSMSTILPSTIRALGERARAAGVGLLDAPVSGGPVVARLGALAIMVGGERKLFDAAKPVLQAMGRTVVHVGALGAGLTLKLVNNMIAINTFPLVIEALRVGLAQGLALPTMIEVIRASSGNTWFTDRWDQARGFLDLLLEDPTQLDALFETGRKDLELGAALCAESGVEAPVLGHAIAGLAGQDVAVLRSHLAALRRADASR